MSGLLRVAVSRSSNIRDVDLSPYWDRLREQGLEPIDYVKPGRSLADCAGLLLTGGRDVDPSLYGEAPHPETDEPIRERDEFELELLHHALEHDMPVFAICRGHQLLNVCLGGSLHQHIETGDHVSQTDEERTSRSHLVRLTAGSRLADWSGTREVLVNSRHHQAVTPERLAPGLRVAGMTADGLVEAMEGERHAWVVGVQWHPERLEPKLDGFASHSSRLFAAFAEAMRR